MQKVVAKSLDNEDTRGMDVRQILRNYKMLEEIFEDVLDEYFSWVETYKAI